MKTRVTSRKTSRKSAEGSSEKLKLSTGRSRRMKCACANCQCTVNPDTATRKGNLVYCSRRCLTECTREQCLCEHDSCAV